MEKLRSVFDPIETINDSVDNPEVFGLIYKAYRPSVEKRIAVEVFCPEDIEDIVQDVFEGAFKNREQPIFSTELKNSVLSWLKKIADHKIADHRRNFLGRTQKRSVAIPLDDVQSHLSYPHDDPAELVAGSDTLTSIAECFAHNKRMIPYSLAIGYTRTDIANDLGVTQSSVTQVIDRAKKKALARKLI